MYIEQVIHPSLQALARMVEEKMLVGGVVAGVRECVTIVDVPSNEEVGKWLRTLPFWSSLRWTVYPLQSFRSAMEQDKAAIEEMKAMVAQR